MDTSRLQPLAIPTNVPNNTRLGHAQSPLIVDMRNQTDFATSTRMVCGAMRLQTSEFEALRPFFAERTLLVYGQDWQQTSIASWQTQGLGSLRRHASKMRADILATRLAGNLDNASVVNALPSILKRPDWGVTGERASRWITRARPKIDRIACPWLITRFIDPRAKFFYVPADRVFEQADALQAVAFDIPGAPVSHIGQHGELCSFDALLAGFDLHVPALDMLARIVRGADTNCLDLSAQCPGLLSTSLGMSELHQNDQHMLSVMMPLYDALYTWCSQMVSGVSESHDWKPIYA